MATEPGRDFSFRVAERPDEVSIVISGTIDETSVLKAPEVRGRRVVIDTHGVDRINSLGVRAWVEMMEDLSRQTHDVVLVKLPAVMVTQASMISTFLGNARIDSFMTPWICLQCDRFVDQLHAANDPVPQAIQCPGCRSAMELDWDRDSYLSFRGG